MKKELDGQIRIAQLSDLHFAPGTLAEVGPCMKSAVSDAIKADVDVAIITGDSTDHALTAQSPALRDLISNVQHLANHCPVLLLQGTFSHEPAGMLHLFHFVKTDFPVLVVDRIGQIALFENEWRWVTSAAECEGARLVVSAVPTVNRADLVSSVGAESVARAMGNVLAGLMGGVFAPVNEAVRAMGIPTVMIGHGTVSGSMTEAGVPMSGLDHEFTLGGIYAAMCSAAMLGHIHLHQSWQREVEGLMQLVAYPGSIGRNHWGEAGEKGFLIWDVRARSASFEFVRTPACRMLDFNFDGAPDLAYIKANAGDCAGAFVRVTFRIDQELISTVDRKAIRQALATAQDVHINGIAIPTIRRRSPGISRLASLSQKAALYCAAVSTVEPEIVVPRLELLQSADPNTIAAAILQRIKDETNPENAGSAGTDERSNVVACGNV